MAWTTLDLNNLLAGEPLIESEVLALYENPIAIAQGAPGAPRVVGDALGLRISQADPSGMNSVIFTDLPETNWTLEFFFIQPDSSSNRSLIMDISYDNGDTFLSGSNQNFTLSGSTNFQVEGPSKGNALAGLTGFLSVSNGSIQNIYTSRARREETRALVSLDITALGEFRNLSLFKPFVPVNAIRLRWNTGSFRAAADQKIILYEGIRKTAGVKP